MAKKIDGINASKKSVELLQKFFDILGEYGGVIETNNPGTWWPLELRVKNERGNEREVHIGVFNDHGYDRFFDPGVNITLTMSENKISEAIVHDLYNTTLFGTSVYRPDGMLYLGNQKEKAESSLDVLFETFMINMAEIGPYLTEGTIKENYSRTRIL